MLHCWSVHNYSTACPPAGGRGGRCGRLRQPYLSSYYCSALIRTPQPYCQMAGLNCVMLQ
jgi:hypothetical protein